MNINEAFPSNYLKASDLQGRRVEVTMADVKTEKLGEDFRPVLSFKGKDKGLVLNKTNANAIIDAYGPETDEWFGKPVVLYEAMVDFQGRRVPAIRVEAPHRPRPAFAERSQAPDRVPDPQPRQAGAGPALDDDIPF